VGSKCAVRKEKLVQGFVIFLSSVSYSYSYEDLGYWKGKTYVVQGETFASCNGEITEETKVYKSKTKAESMAKKLLYRCSNVSSWRVEENQ
jgi:hypothetical protein